MTGLKAFDSSYPNFSSGSDLVSLLPFQDYIEDEFLLMDLMVEQGLTGFDYVEITGLMMGGS